MATAFCCWARTPLKGESRILVGRSNTLTSAVLEDLSFDVKTVGCGGSQPSEFGVRVGGSIGRWLGTTSITQPLNTSSVIEEVGMR